MKTTAINYIKRQIKSLNHQLEVATSEEKNHLNGQKDALMKMAFSLYSVKVKDLDNLTY